jgi:hypothetical protein
MEIAFRPAGVLGRESQAESVSTPQGDKSGAEVKLDRSLRGITDPKRLRAIKTAAPNVRLVATSYPVDEMESAAKAQCLGLRIMPEPQDQSKSGDLPPAPRITREPRWRVK